MYQIIPKQPGIGNTLYHKIWLIMRLTTVLILASLLQVSAATFGQKITLNQQNTALKSIFKEIRKQSGYDFLYEGSMVTNDLKASLNVRSASIEEAMNKLFQNLPLSYKITEKLVIIKKKENTTLIDNLIARFQNIDVKGKVVDTTGNALAAATVTVKGTKNSVSTSANGDFLLKNVDEAAILVVTFMGYETKEVTANKGYNYIQLRMSDNKLDEIQVIAYGQTTRRFSTSNIGTVSAKDIANQPVTNPLLALQGRVPGLVIEQSTGFANGGVKVRIQGQNSMRADSDPLYVIDGIPYFPQLIPGDANGIVLGQSGANAQVFGSPLSYINPSEIESISILKDADATSIYGSRAANGAILITTKKGKSGKTVTSFNVRQGIGKVGRFMKLLNAEQYLDMRREAYFSNDGLTTTSDQYAEQYDINGVWDASRETDWQKTLLGGTAKTTDADFSVSGGSSAIQFMLSGNYHTENNIFAKQFKNTRGGTRLNISNSSDNQNFRIQGSIGLLFDDNKLPTVDLTSLALTLSPVAPELYNSDGSLNWAPRADGVSTWTNPLAKFKETQKTLTKNLVSNISASYEIFNGFDIKTILGYNNLQLKSIQLSPIAALAPEEQVYNQGSSRRNIDNLNSWSIEPQLTYKKQIGNDRLEMLAGAALNVYRNESLGVLATGFTDDSRLDYIAAGTGTIYPNESVSEYKYAALYGRFNYIAKEKYILNTSIRRDGSSRFGDRNQFHTFWSIAGGWIFTDEPILKDFRNILSFGKLRMSYGTSGNDQIGDYRFLNQYQNFGSVNRYQDAGALFPEGLPNPYLEWEETRKWQGGLDIGFFEDQRVLVTANYFRNRSSNQLLQYSLPATTGSTSITRNLPATLQNSGWELSLNTTNIKKNDIEWHTNFNVTIPNNKLVEFPNIENSSYFGYVVGGPFNANLLYLSLGVDSQTGLYQFVGSDGNPTSNPSKDVTTVVNTLPKYYTGIQSSFRYKSFSFDIMLQFVRQKSIDDFGLLGRVPGYFSGKGNLGNQPASLLQRWRKPGDLASVQKVTATNYDEFNNLYTALISDQVYRNGDFLRLKNVALNWELSNKFLKYIPLRSCRIYLQAQNLLTLTKYTGLDPETRTSTALPPLKMIVAGINLTL